MSMLTIAIPQFVENLRKNIQGVETTEELLIRTLIAVGSVVVLLLLRNIISGGILTVIGKTFCRRKPRVQSLIKDGLKKPLAFFLVLAGIALGLQIIAPSGELHKIGLFLIKAGGIVCACWGGVRLLNGELDNYTFDTAAGEDKTRLTAFRFISNVAKIVIICIGAFLGGGSGVIIKPLLTLLVDDTTEVINFISSVSVFAMSCSSTVKHLRAKTKVDFKTVLLISAGSILGGFAGKHIFDLFNRLLSDNLAMAYQAVMLACLLTVALWYVNKGKKSFHLKNPITILLGGVVLGILSSFLGIGGGPINIMFFLLFFSMSMKEATVYSVAVIFFSQLSKLVTYVATATVPKFDYRILLIAAPAAVIAGIIGAALNKKANNKIVTRVFSAVLGVFICLNIYNAITGFMAG